MLDILETILAYVYSSLQMFWPPLVFIIISILQYYVNLSTIYQSELNANEIEFFTLYSAT